MFLMSSRKRQSSVLVECIHHIWQWQLQPLTAPLTASAAFHSARISAQCARVCTRVWWTVRADLCAKETTALLLPFASHLLHPSFIHLLSPPKTQHTLTRDTNCLVPSTTLFGMCLFSVGRDGGLLVFWLTQTPLSALHDVLFVVFLCTHFTSKGPLKRLVTNKSN